MKNRNRIIAAAIVSTLTIGSWIFGYMAEEEAEKQRIAKSVENAKRRDRQMAEMNKHFDGSDNYKEFIEKLKAGIQSSGLPLQVSDIKGKEGVPVTKKRVIIAKADEKISFEMKDGKAHIVGFKNQQTIVIIMGLLTSVSLTWDRQEIAFEKLLNKIIGEMEAGSRSFKVVTPISAI